MQKEAKARILINDLLLRSGWRFFDDETGPANIALEAHVKLMVPAVGYRGGVEMATRWRRTLKNPRREGWMRDRGSWS